MASQTKFLHLRHAFLLAALFTALTLSVWSDSTTPAVSAGPVVMPPTNPTPPWARAHADATPAPAPAPVSVKDKTAAAIAQRQDDAPVVLPPVQPITVHTDRDYEIGHMVGELLEQNHYIQKPITPDIRYAG